MTRFSSIKLLVTNLMKECTLYTKCISILLILFYICSFVHSASQYLTIIPAYILPPGFWIFSLLTFSFFESKILFIILDIITIFFMEKLLLPVWGWLELIKFCALVNCFSAINAVFVYILFYAITRNEVYLFDTKIHGMIPLLAALTVASRQLMGDNVLMNLKFSKFRNKHISIVFLSTLIILILLKIIYSSVLIMYINGLFISWIYLRFFQKHGNGNVGDLSEKFAFSEFFPYYLEGPVSIISNSIFGLLIYLKICKKIDRRYDISSPTTISISISSGDVMDSERRKQLALKALNERLSQKEKSVEWISMDDDDKEVKSNSIPSDPSAGKLLSTMFIDSSRTQPKLQLSDNANIAVHSVSSSSSGSFTVSGTASSIGTAPH